MLRSLLSGAMRSRGGSGTRSSGTRSSGYGSTTGGLGGSRSGGGGLGGSVGRSLISRLTRGR